MENDCRGNIALTPVIAESETEKPFYTKLVPVKLNNSTNVVLCLEPKHALIRKGDRVFVERAANDARPVDCVIEGVCLEGAALVHMDTIEIMRYVVPEQFPPRRICARYEIETFDV